MQRLKSMKLKHVTKLIGRREKGLVFALVEQKTSFSGMKIIRNK